MSACRICGSKELSEVYFGAIRLGSFGKLTDDKFRVYECQDCSTAFLDPFPEQPDNYYENGAYRDNYNDSTLISDYYKNHDLLLKDRISRIKVEELRGKSIADVGAGGGSFLDLVTGVADRTVAVEPTNVFHSKLKEQHSVYGYADELIKNDVKMDIVTSFDVIEHVPNPIKFAEELKALLKDDGKLILTTPNHREILREIVNEEFSSFYYRTAHLYYFTSEAIEFVLRQAGFSDVSVQFQHRYDLSNAFLWARDRKPTGIGACGYFDEATNYAYRKSLENSGMASDLWIEARI